MRFFHFDDVDCGGEACFADQNRRLFGPKDVALNSVSNKIGAVRSNGIYGSGVVRGGYFNVISGIFHTDLSANKEAVSSKIGGRCVWAP